MAMQLILFTRTNPRAGREANFIRMIKSVETSADGIPLKIFALFQPCNEADKLRYQQLMPAGSVVVASPERLSLSEARNRLFGAAKNHVVVNENCVIGFPNDDCWYPPGFVRQLVSAFSRDVCLDMLACRPSFHPVDTSWIDENFAPATASRVVRRASSNSMFFRGQLVAQLGPFDETQDLDEPNGREDFGYTVRALLAARRAAFVDLPIVGHRESDLASAARYYTESLRCARAFSG